MIFLSLRVTADAEGGLKNRAQVRPVLQGFGGGQPPTSTRRVYTGALLAATKLGIPATKLGIQPVSPLDSKNYEMNREHSATQLNEKFPNFSAAMAICSGVGSQKN